MSWAAWAAGEATRALLAFPLASASIMFADVLRNWILDSWEGKDRDNGITALPGLSTHTRHTESHSRKVSSEGAGSGQQLSPLPPESLHRGHVSGHPPKLLWPLQASCRTSDSSQRPRSQLPPPGSSFNIHTMEGDGGDARVHRPHPLRTAGLAWLGSVAPEKASLPTPPSPSEITGRV